LSNEVSHTGAHQRALGVVWAWPRRVSWPGGVEVAPLLTALPLHPEAAVERRSAHSWRRLEVKGGLPFSNSSLSLSPQLCRFESIAFRKSTSISPPRTA